MKGLYTALLILLVHTAVAQNEIENEIIIQIEGSCTDLCITALTIASKVSLGPGCRIADDIVAIGGISFILLRCPEKIRSSFAIKMLNVGGVNVKKASPNAIKKAIFPKTSPNENARKRKSKKQKAVQKTASAQKVPWGVDEVDGDYDNKRSCKKSRNGNGVHVLVIDTGCKPMRGGKCGSAFTSDKGKCTDREGHGTHVAGTVGSSKYGVAPKATVSCFKSLDDEGEGSTWALLKGLRFGERRNVDVINLSLGGERVESENDAVFELSKKGIFVTVAAGNDDYDACKDSPGSSKGQRVFTVQAHDEDGFTYEWSNWGRCTDLSAPGVDIVSADVNGGSISFDGTSMAAPHVAGAIALLISDRKTVNLRSLTRNGYLIETNDDDVIKSIGFKCP